MKIQKAHAKAIHIAKSQKKPAARPKLVNKYVFAIAERTIEIEKPAANTRSYCIAQFAVDMNITFRNLIYL